MGSSSKSIVTGYTYNGSNAQVVCIGPVDILHQITNGDTVVFQGPIFRSSADADGKTILTTTIGTIRFYWGSATQNADSILSNLVLDAGDGASVVPMPPWRNICYAVNVDVDFGQQTTPPTLLFDVSKFPDALPLEGRVTRITVTNGGSGYATPPAVGFSGGDGSGVAAHSEITGGVVTAVVIDDFGTGYTVAPDVGFSGGGGSGAVASATLFHEIDGDAILPEVIYDLLTNNLYGAGVPAGDLVEDTFTDAAEQTASEGIGVSPMIDENSNARDLIGKLLQYIDGAIYLQGGRMAFKLIRKEDTTGILSISEADMVDEPQPDDKGLDATWNFTLLKFTDRNNQWEFATEPYDDASNSAIVGESIPKEINLPFITQRDVAKIVVKNLGIKGGTSPAFWNLRLLPKHSTIEPGQIAFLSYAKRGISNRLVRCMEITRGGPTTPEVEATFMEEMTRDTSHDYVPPADAFEVDPRISANGTGNFDLVSTTPRLLILPSGLKAGKADGWLTAMNRPDAVTDDNKVFWTFDEIKVPYRQVDTRSNFPVKGEVVAWWKFRTDANWILRIRLPVAMDYDTLANLGLNSAEFYFVAARRIVKEVGSPQDEHQVDGVWCQKIENGYFLPQSATVYDIEVSDEAFGSLGLALETIAAPGNFPTLHCYLGRKDDFAVVVSDAIQFERGGANAPAIGGLSLITHGTLLLTYDGNLKRIVKATVGNYAGEQEISDVVSTYYDRDDTTMCPDGTFERDWGEFAPTGYELFDTSGGERVASGTENADYPNVVDLDEALGAVYEDLTTTDQQALLSESIDLVLGYMVANDSFIYNDAP